MTENIDINNISYNIKEDEILYVYTKKIPAFKALIEALKEIFRDVSVKFTPRIEKPIENEPGKTKVTGGMYITALNSNSNILVRLHLEADKFGFYKCEPGDNKNYIMLGINMSNLFKLIKFLNNDDELFLIYNKSSLNQLNLQYVNKQKKFMTNYYLNLLDLKEDNIIIGKQNFDFVITMPSNDFHGLIKNMSVIAEQVDIKFVSTENNYSLIFSCQGEFASQVAEFNGSKNGDNIINVSKNEDNENDTKEINNIVQGVYELKSLSLFSRCSSMCPMIELYIRNDTPLVIKYRVADMGTVHLILSPINNNNQINNDSDDDDDNNGNDGNDGNDSHDGNE